MTNARLAPLFSTQPAPVWVAFAVGIVALLALPTLGEWTLAVATTGAACLLAVTRLTGQPLVIVANALAAAGVVGALLSPAWGDHPDALAFLLALPALAVIAGRTAALPTPATAAGSPAPTQSFITHVQYSVDGMIKSAQAVSAVSVQQSQGADEQMALIRHTTQSIDHFMAMSQVALDRIRTLTRTAQDARASAEEGQAALAQAIDSMEKIRAQVALIGTTTVQLAQFTRRIDRIITSVSEIATQSNLLALNASIEAARAGAHGRGFAVVADEVRALAQQSTQAAGQVRAILGEIQSGVRETVLATETGMQQVDAGAQVTQAANAVMARLSHHVTDVNDSIRVIAQTLREQADGMEEIGISMERVDRIAQQNQGTTRIISQVSHSLSQLAEELEGVLQAQALAVNDPPAAPAPARSQA